MKKHQFLFFLVIQFITIFFTASIDFKKIISTQLIQNSELPNSTEYLFGFKIGCFSQSNKTFGSFFNENISNKNIITYNDYLVSLGSATKFVVAFVLIKTIHSRIININLDDDFSQWFPEYKNWFSVGNNHLKLFHLLSMSSGIPDYLLDEFDDFFIKNEKNHVNPYQLIDLVKNKPLIFSPGKKYMYSNTNYILIGILLEKIFNMPLNEIIKKEVLIPLKLNSISLVDAVNIENKNFNKNLFYPKSINHDINEKSVYFYNYTFAYSAGAMVSTLSDIYKLINILISDEKMQWYKTLLTNKKYCTLIDKSSELETFYCLGTVNTHFQKTNFTLITHSGELDGNNNEHFFFIIFPREKLTAVMSLISKNSNISLEEIFLSHMLPKINEDKINFNCL